MSNLSVRSLRRAAHAVVAERIAACGREAAKYRAKDEDINARTEDGAAAVATMILSFIDELPAKTGAELKMKIIIIADRARVQLDKQALATRGQDIAPIWGCMWQEARYVGELIEKLDGALDK